MGNSADDHPPEKRLHTAFRASDGFNLMSRGCSITAALFLVNTKSSLAARKCDLVCGNEALGGRLH